MGNFFVFGSALLMAGVLVGCREQRAPITPPPEVRVFTVQEGAITESISAVGEAKAYDSVDLVARVEGYLIKRNFQEGESVKKGQLLYQIEPEIYQAKVKAAEADLEKARAAQKNTDSEYRRQQTLAQKDATSERAFELAGANKLEADANVKAAEAALAVARQNLSYTRITAPFDGWVGLSAIGEGNLVNLASGPLATLQGTDPMRIEFVLNEMDLLAIQQYFPAGETPEREGDQVRVLLYLQDGTRYPLEGKIKYWNNRINPSTGTLKLQAVFPNPRHQLIPGMFTKVELQPPAPRRAPVIPLQAIMNDQAGEYVYVVAPDGTVSRRTIQTGYHDGAFAIVADKLAPGEQIIVEGIQKVRPGERAKPTVDAELEAAAPKAEVQPAGAPAK